jgi:hypothetical protein
MRLEVDAYDRSYILYNIGLIHTSNGEHGRALEYVDQALDADIRCGCGAFQTFGDATVNEDGSMKHLVWGWWHKLLCASVLRHCHILCWLGTMLWGLQCHMTIV